jgi:RNA polymerase sigma-70 factor (ECF subfamily)
MYCIGWCFPNFKIMVTSTEITTQLHAIVRGFVGKQIQDQDDCDDVVQNFFMNIHEKIAGLQEMEKANAWFFTSAQNAIED